MKNVFVTGASGFLGRELVKKLIAEGYKVFALARSEVSQRIIEEAGATSVRGDLEHPLSYEQSLVNMDVVVHCAARVSFWGEWSLYKSNIIDATLNLAKLSEAYKIKKFIHISSESVMQDQKDLLDVNESMPLPSTPNSYYGKAKKITEEKLLSQEFAMKTIILRPTFIWGNNCDAINGILTKVKKSQFLWINNGEGLFEAVHVLNVVEAIYLSIQYGED